MSVKLSVTTRPSWHQSLPCDCVLDAEVERRMQETAAFEAKRSRHGFTVTAIDGHGDVATMTCRIVRQFTTGYRFAEPEPLF